VRTWYPGFLSYSGARLSEKMQAVMKQKLKLLYNSNFKSLFTLSSFKSHCYSSPLNSLPPSSTSVFTATNSFTTPWSTIQRRGNKIVGSDVRIASPSSFTVFKSLPILILTHNFHCRSELEKRSENKVTLFFFSFLLSFNSNLVSNCSFHQFDMRI